MGDEPPELPFDPQKFDVRKAWFLVGWSPYAVFIPEQVHRWASPNSKTRDLVPLFHDHDLVHFYADELARKGIGIEVQSLHEVDALTDLLSKLKDLGATHVVFDPRGTDFCRYSIDRIIISLQLAE